MPGRGRQGLPTEQRWRRMRRQRSKLNISERSNRRGFFCPLVPHFKVICLSFSRYARMRACAIVISGMTPIQDVKQVMVFVPRHSFSPLETKSPRHSIWLDFSVVKVWAIESRSFHLFNLVRLAKRLRPACHWRIPFFGAISSMIAYRLTLCGYVVPLIVYHFLLKCSPHVMASGVSGPSGRSAPRAAMAGNGDVIASATTRSRATAVRTAKETDKRKRAATQKPARVRKVPYFTHILHCI